MEVRASAGDNFLGGEDFDDAVVAHFLGAMAGQGLPDPQQPAIHQRLRREAQRVRHALGQQPEAVFQLREDGREWTLPLSQDKLLNICEPLLERLRAPIERALRDARIKVADLDEVLLVGGTTRMPLAVSYTHLRAHET